MKTRSWTDGWERPWSHGTIAGRSRHTPEGHCLFVIGTSGEWTAVINPMTPQEVELGTQGRTCRPPIEWAERLYAAALVTEKVQPAQQGCEPEFVEVPW